MQSRENNKTQLQTVDHVGIRTKDLDKVVERWSSMFGVASWKFRELSGTDAKGRPWKVKMAFSNVGPLGIHIIQPVEGRVFHSRRLDNMGEGLDHLGYFVDDVDAEVSALVAKGATLLFGEQGNFAYLEADGIMFQPMRNGYLG